MISTRSESKFIPQPAKYQIFVLQTNVPNIRLTYRHDTLLGELDLIRSNGEKVPGPADLADHYQNSGPQVKIP